VARQCHEPDDADHSLRGKRAERSKLLNFSANVTCLYVVGNQAIVGGVVTSGGEPGQIGTGFAVGFIDNPSPTPDTVTFGDLELATPVDCAAEAFLFTLTTFPVLDGNIVVRDAP
jgi:hypothetical protein